MKNSEIHNNLSDKDIRNFISQMLHKINNEIISLRVKRDTTNICPITTTLNNEKLLVDYHSKRVELYEQLLSVIKIMKMKNWSEFDVSNVVLNDLNGYHPFIGNDNEYQLFYDNFIDVNY